MELSLQHTYVLILAGGSGKRLWPYSRKAQPKQFLDFFGMGKSLLQLTYERFNKFIPKERIIISTFQEQKKLVEQQIPEVLPENILAEPVQLNTAPSAAWGTLYAYNLDPNANLIVTPADQYVLNDALFAEQLKKGVGLAEQEKKAVVLGVIPSLPNPNYGYIQKGKSVEKGLGYTIQSFSEKPNIEFARVFTDSGEFLWNTGLFVWNVKAMLKQLPHFLPSTDPKLLQPEYFSAMTFEEKRAEIYKHYAYNDFLSLDMVILEKLATSTLVQPCNYGWVDLGTWLDIDTVAPKDIDGNSSQTKENLLMRGCKNNIIHLPKGKLGIFQGLENYLIADNQDILVIVKKEDKETLRNLMNETILKFGDSFM